MQKVKEGVGLGGVLIRRDGTILEKVKGGGRGQRSGRLLETMGKPVQADGQS